MYIYMFFFLKNKIKLAKTPVLGWYFIVFLDILLLSTVPWDSIAFVYISYSSSNITFQVSIFFNLKWSQFTNYFKFFSLNIDMQKIAWFNLISYLNIQNIFPSCNKTIVIKGVRLFWQPIFKQIIILTTHLLWICLILNMYLILNTM